MNVPVARNCCIAPAPTEAFEGVSAIESRPAVDPVPDRLTVCGLLLPLSVTVSVPVRAPTTVGVKVALIVHLVPAATELPQVLVWAKSPTVETLVIASAVVRLLESVTESGLLVVPTVLLANVSLVTDKVTALTPVPLVAIACGLSLALSVMVTVPLYAPVTVGLKVIEIVHFAPAATELPQVLVCAKFALATTLVTDKAALPVLVNVTFLAALVDPMTAFPNLRLLVESEAVCACAAMLSRANSRPQRTNSTQYFRGRTPGRDFLTHITIMPLLQLAGPIGVVLSPQKYAGGQPPKENSEPGLHNGR